MQILRVEDLKTHFNTAGGLVKAVDGVSFTLDRGEILGLVGESGAGKSVTALTLLGLAWGLGDATVSGSAWFDGKNLLSGPEQYRQIRGKRIALIPQEPGAALNPMMKVGKQFHEMVRVHMGLSPGEGLLLIQNALKDAELPDPDHILDLYPYQLSGGILQRVLLAMAVCCQPDILIADEPASSLDVTIQAQVLSLLRKLVTDKGLAIILIAHDLAVISQYSHKLLVMYGGQVVESGPTAQVLGEALHPYTRSLLELYRSTGPNGQEGYAGAGFTPFDSWVEGTGCVFARRCGLANEQCRLERPGLKHIQEGRTVACPNGSKAGII